MRHQVLVVDDVASAADEYARLIHLKTRLSAVAATTAAVAIELARTNPIRVAVLDQRMPERTGTDLFGDLIKIDSSLKAIMLTGEAEAADVAAAMKLGFIDYLHKSEVAELPARVMAAYAAYEADLAKRVALAAPAVLCTVHRGLFGMYEVSLVLVSMDVLDDTCVRDDAWVTTKQLNAGERVKEIDKFEITHRFVHEHTAEEKLLSQAGFDLKNIATLKVKLESAVSERYHLQQFAENRRSVEIARDYSLPEEPVDPGELHVVSRHFQRAPVYRKIRALANKVCTCCSAAEPMVFVLYQLTSRIATRQVDYFSDGSSKILSTGVELY